MQLTPEEVVSANQILSDRKESKRGLAAKLGLARSTVVLFFSGRSVSQEVYDKLKSYLDIENVDYQQTATIQVYQPEIIPPTLEEIKFLYNSDSPHLKHLFTCLMFNYLITNQILVERNFILSILNVKRLPVSWCGYRFFKEKGGYVVVRL